MPIGVRRGCVKLTVEELKSRKAARMRACYAASPEKFKAKVRAYREMNPNKVKSLQSTYAAANRKKLNAKQKVYAATNPEKVKACHAACRAANPEVYRQHHRRRRASKRAAAIGDSREIIQWEKTWRAQKTVKCHWCSKRIKPPTAHVDHVIPLSKGGAHALGNLCVSCSTCNLCKNAKPPEAWNASLPQPLLFL